MEQRIIGYKDFKITPHYLCTKQCRLKLSFQTALEQKPKQRARAYRTHFMHGI
ncbi:hypothetical protein [Neisseria canis]|uniref:hypothetical protein n=1 Tax=Neisseria canis TaxID=493 RepID=UPI001301CF93|nr:hypothetical protein [Neisseria canis]